MLVLGLERRRTMTEAMTEAGTPLRIKRYAGKRLYDPAAGAYLTLDDLAQRVRGDEDFTVTEAATGEDITGAVLKQIIVERGRHG
jgi:polyhydroxyalkanoate synthesis repressor PhaR